MGVEHPPISHPGSEHRPEQDQDTPNREYPKKIPKNPNPAPSTREKGPRSAPNREYPPIFHPHRLPQSKDQNISYVVEILFPATDCHNSLWLIATTFERS